MPTQHATRQAARAPQSSQPEVTTTARFEVTSASGPTPGKRLGVTVEMTGDHVAAVHPGLTGATDAQALLRALESVRQALVEVRDRRRGRGLSAAERVRNQRERMEEIASYGGGYLDGATMADTLGISRQALHERRRNRTILALPWGRSFIYPIWQLDLKQHGRVVSELADVLKAVSIEDPWGIAGILTAEADALDGRVPVDELKAGGERARRAAAAVNRTIQELYEPVSHERA
jgi:hypothetical protein